MHLNHDPIKVCSTLILLFSQQRLPISLAYQLCSFNLALLDTMISLLIPCYPPWELNWSDLLSAVQLTLEKVILSWAEKSQNTSGMTKLRRETSSSKLFCTGVPVSNSRLLACDHSNNRVADRPHYCIL